MKKDLSHCCVKNDTSTFRFTGKFCVAIHSEELKLGKVQGLMELESD